MEKPYPPGESRLAGLGAPFDSSDAFKCVAKDVGVEIISGVGRRRRWRVEEKLRIVAEADEPGACFVEVARRHDLSRGLLWHWRRQVRSGALRAPADQQFLPVHVVSATAQAASVQCHEPTPPEISGQGMIEIALPDGVMVRVSGEVGAVALRRVLDALRG